MKKFEYKQKGLEGIIGQHHIWKVNKDIHLSDGVFPQGTLVTLGGIYYHIKDKTCIMVHDLYGCVESVEVNNEIHFNELFQSSHELDILYEEYLSELSNIRTKQEKYRKKSKTIYAICWCLPLNIVAIFLSYCIGNKFFHSLDLSFLGINTYASLIIVAVLAITLLPVLFTIRISYLGIEEKDNQKTPYDSEIDNAKEYITTMAENMTEIDFQSIPDNVMYETSKV